MIRTYKAEGIIIKRFEIGEADRILIAFTREKGKVVLKARGVRKILAKLKGHIELFTLSKFVIARSRRGSIDTIIQAETKDSFIKLKNSLKKTSRIYLIFEFLDKIFSEQEPNKEVFDLLIYVLKNIEKNKSRERRLLIIAYFYLQVLKRLGYYPHFRECTVCQLPLQRGGNYFDFNGAGTIGRDHVEGGKINNNNERPDLVKISDEAVIGLRYLIENGEKRLKKINTKKEVVEELYNIAERYASTIIDSELKSKQFVGKVD